MNVEITKAWIKERIPKSEYLISKHADDERRNDNLSLDDLERALQNGDIIEEYPDTGRGPSCLVCNAEIEKPVHVVCGKNKHSWLVLITVYSPAMPKWKSPTERNR